MHPRAFEQFERLERDHWWFRGRRTVYLGLLERHLRAHPGAPALAGAPALTGALGGSGRERALDLGTGVGGFLPGLAQLFDRVVPADTDAGALAVCARRAWPANVAPPVRIESERLPFDAASFDLASLFDVLEHLDDEGACLREVHRVLRPGGRLIASVPAYPALWSNNDRIAGHRRRYTRASLAAALAGAGFEVERNTHANVLLTPLIVPVTLAGKLWEATLGRGADSEHTNLSWRLPRPLHALLYRAFAAELPLTARRDLPFGHSIAAIARRP